MARHSPLVGLPDDPQEARIADPSRDTPEGTSPQPLTIDPLKEPGPENPVLWSAMTAQDSDVTGLGLSDEAAAIRARRAAGIEEAKEASETGFFEALGIGFKEGDTAAILRAMDPDKHRGWQDFDPEFDAQAGVREAAEAFDFTLDEGAIEYLSVAGTEADMLERARQYRQHLDNMQVLSRHGGAAFTAGMLDPAWVIADLATFRLARVGQLGRVGTGLVAGTGGLGVTAVADSAGQDKSGFDYILNAAMLGGAGALLGTGRAARVARGEGTDVTPPNAVTPRERGGLGAIRANVNEFTTEVDRLAMPTRAGAAERIAMVGRVVDDPLVRPEFMQDTPATSWLRMYRNEADGELIQYHNAVENALKAQGFGLWSRKVDVSGQYSSARDALERTVAEEIVERDQVWRETQQRFRGTDPVVADIADRLEALHNRVGEIARDSTLRGFEDFSARPGYFHRSWNARAIVKADPEVARRVISLAATRGMPWIDKETADLIAKSITDRAVARTRNEGLEFFGSIGKNDTDMLEEILREAPGISAARVDSIMNRLRQNLDEAGVVKYGKGRLPLDMRASITLDDGSTLSMLDLIDTDLGRLAENYVTSMTGRSALAKAGIGGDDASIAAFRRDYADTLRELPEGVRKDRMLTLEGLLGDFTGTRPENNVLGEGLQRLKSITDSTVLAASGLWQVAQYADMAAVIGVRETTKEFFKSFPGSRSIFKNAAKDPDLADELNTVLGLDLGRDVRWHPWLRQHDVNLAAADSSVDRILHAGKQATPYLNAMRFVHRHQARMNTNLGMNTVARAAAGDAKSLALLKEYGLKGAKLDRVLQEARSRVRYRGRGNKNAAEMNWGAWDTSVRDDALNTTLRIMDDAIVYGRPGQAAGSPIMARSQAGQLLGQFRAWVAVAHNKLLRGTLSRRGWGGLGMLLVYQYPITYMMTALNEIRAGRGEDMTPETVAVRAIGYTGGLGLAGEAIAITGLSGGRGGITVPITSTLEGVPRAFGAARKLGTGDFRGGTADTMKAAGAVLPGVAIMPGTALAIEAVRGDD